MSWKTIWRNSWWRKLQAYIWQSCISCMLFTAQILTLYWTCTKKIFKIKDYWRQFEWQSRESPHVHGVLCLDDEHIYWYWFDFHWTIGIIITIFALQFIRYYIVHSLSNINHKYDFLIYQNMIIREIYLIQLILFTVIPNLVNIISEKSMGNLNVDFIFHMMCKIMPIWFMKIVIKKWW